MLVSFSDVSDQVKQAHFGFLHQTKLVLSIERPYPSNRMHLSLDTMNMVDDSCLSPSNFHDMVKAGGAVVGTRVHSIDVILGFNKDQDSLLNPGVNAVGHKVGGESLGEPGKQDQRVQSYGHLPPLRDGTEQPTFHGKSFMEEYRVLLRCKSCLLHTVIS